MRALSRWYAGVLYVISLSAYAVIPYCPPSLEAPLDNVVPGKLIAFPRGHLFQPLIADPKETRFFIGYRDYERTVGGRAVGVIGFGETFPLFRRAGACATDGLQLDLVGGGVARFVLDDSRKDLIDADYTFGLPLSWRRGNWSMRSRIYHESSHLGENHLFQAGASERVKRSYDSMDFIASYDKERWRIYYGGEYLLRHHPTIDPLGLHVGAEYYGPRNMFGGSARWITGLDLKAWDEYAFEPEVSLKTGLSFGGRQANQHHLQLLLEWYDGHANEGVFFEEDVRYSGVGVYFGF